MHGQQEGQDHPVFMGYGSIEALLDGVDPRWTQIYLFMGMSSESTKYGNVHGRTFWLLLSRVEGTMVHYCKVDYGACQVITDHTGAPVGDCQRELERINARGNSLEEAVKTYLQQRGFAAPREAAATFPTSYRPIVGIQRFAKFNREANAFILESEAA